MERNRIIFAVTIALVLNLGGAIISKYLALNLHNFFWAGIWLMLLAAVYLARMKYWVWAGKLYQLSYLYPFMSLSYIISLGFGYLLFNESITVQKLLGSILIVAGVYTVSLSSNKTDAKHD